MRETVCVNDLLFSGEEFFRDYVLRLAVAENGEDLVFGVSLKECLDLSLEIKFVLPYAKTVRSLGSSIIFAQPLTQPVKLFTAWTEDKYYSGRVGDYIAVRADDEHDIYIINRDIMDKSYKPY